ncbi:HsdR family type I site-specific deoxyribonuclease [Sphaerospermopsis kisseleviana CS-549]|uniref:Type I restriction enzyme endonuclease subunit n=1 Tax=Sphaerospermopsis kisseleviana CS-549 TaxID=3021783 RepID=A0ABT4ZVS4_9CYAN|nr:HsdR family type I site-specific deoxyribonuclease [Sphaerospermopsis kisseleviana]MDB9443510.1 HsdR family type I site-specific deoxyribonuclease [Sphaerospermopsis kisseleviana CS-549]BAZ80659.1 type I site-specific deoxyribonuclease chain R [Sphaerospermopsis kisseleviana NIES-73]
MNEVGQPERATQNRVIALLTQKLGYQYIGNWYNRANNSNIETDLLTTFLRDIQKYPPDLINKALHELTKHTNDKTQNLYNINKEIYTLLRYGIKIKPEAGENTQTLYLINWEEPLKNSFYIAEEVSIKGENTKRPDIVLYINGIALAVLELKRSTVPVSEAIRQNLDNQKSIFIKPFFNTIQLVMAGNDTQGLRYGTIETPEKYYLTWKEDTHSEITNTLNITNILDQHLLQLCEKHRFLEIIHDFTLFDSGIKKICRSHQYLGIKAAQEYIKRREGGIIWHTQGSGKSLTMVWLTKWIREYNPNTRVLIITDREELDGQIESIFLGVNENIYRTQSSQDLITQLQNTTPSLICSLIHKFGKNNSNNESKDYEEFIKQIKRNLPQNFQPQGEFYVFVDECHRTQSGKLHKAMKKILPNALFIGFTGTPLLKQDKQKSIEVFGNYIHTYKFNEAVEDQVVLDLRYEARHVEQYITSQSKIDQWFESKTKQLTETAKAELKKRWGTMQKILSSKSRLEIIVKDIMLDFSTKDRLQNSKGNAILVAGSIYEACKYYEIFQNAGFSKCAIITSYDGSLQSIKGETTGEGKTDKIHQYEIYQKMLNGQKPDKFETEVKNDFVHHPEKMKLLIVVNKLLTGFDAPPATYLYIDKSMRDHDLFQAVCRVNRLHTPDKEYGYIIDYKDLFKSLEKSVYDYTSAAFSEYDSDDINGLLTDRLEKGKNDLETAREALKALCEPVKYPYDTPDYIKYFCGNTQNPEDLQTTEPRRLVLYKSVAALVRKYANIANELETAGYTTREIFDIQQEVKHYQIVSEEIKLASGDKIDFKVYQNDMRHLIDSYIGAKESQILANFENLTLVELIVNNGVSAVNSLPPGIRNNQTAVAETIENNLRKLIIEQEPTNPKYFEKISILLNELIAIRQDETLAYQEYLQKIVALAKQIHQPSTSSQYPESLDTPAKRSLYDNLDQNEELALDIDAAVRNSQQDSWRGNKMKERLIKNAIKKYIKPEDLESIFEIIKQQSEY